MVTAGSRIRRRDEEERIILMKSRDRRAERMSQYNVMVGITRNDFFKKKKLKIKEVQGFQEFQIILFRNIYF